MRWISLLVLLAAGFFGFFLLRSYSLIRLPDTQCSKVHLAPESQPQNPTTAQDYFTLGNYFYDVGKCQEAIVAYSSAVEKDSTVPEYFNNRGYTYMRLRDYKNALADLDMAISLNPNYVEALMNRADIYNYYYAIDRKKAINDYNAVIALGIDKDKSKSVCGHKAMAETNNIVPLAILKIITNTGCQE